jgi:NADH:ubiquinone oxidoreductase subunit E
LTETAKAPPELRALIADVKPDNADLLAVFHRIQEAYGYVPPEAVPLLAAKLRTTPAMVFGALSFYSEIRTEPPPRLTISWCSGPACRLKGSENIRRTLESILGIELGQSTPDLALGLRLVQCDGTCALAPLLRLNGRPRGPLTVAEAIRLARELRGAGENGQQA